MAQKQVKYGIDFDLLHETNQSVEISKETLNTLVTQTEQLQRIERTVDSEAYIIAKSDQIIERMSWWGWLKSWFQLVPNKQLILRYQPEQEIEQRKKNEKINEACENLTQNNINHISEMTTIEQKLNEEGKTNQEVQENVMSAQLQYLNVLSGNLYDLKEMNVLASEELDKQNEMVTSITYKVDDLDEDVRRVTRKAKDLIQSDDKKHESFKNYVVLQDVLTKLYISVQNEDICLVESNITKNCRFALFERIGQINIIGLKSCISLRWIGQDMFGKMKAKSFFFGKNEEFEIDPTEINTALLVCSANGREGGYLKYNYKKNSFEVISTNRENATWFQIINCNSSQDCFLTEELKKIESC